MLPMRQNPPAGQTSLRQLLRHRIRLDRNQRQRQTLNVHDYSRGATAVPRPRALYRRHRAAGERNEASRHDLRHDRECTASRLGCGVGFQRMQHRASVAPMAKILLQTSVKRGNLKPKNFATELKLQNDTLSVNRPNQTRPSQTQFGKRTKWKVIGLSENEAQNQPYYETDAQRQNADN